MPRTIMVGHTVARAAPRLKDAVAAFARADADGVFDREDEDLAVADGTRLRDFDDGLDDAIHFLVGDDDLELALGEKVDAILAAAVELGVAFLASEALHLGDRETLDPDLHQRGLHIVELEWLDECFDFFHARRTAKQRAKRVQLPSTQ